MGNSGGLEYSCALSDKMTLEGRLNTLDQLFKEEQERGKFLQTQIDDLQKPISDIQDSLIDYEYFVVAS